jgi:hypothetical protein
MMRDFQPKRTKNVTPCDYCEKKGIHFTPKTIYDVAMHLIETHEMEIADQERKAAMMTLNIQKMFD